MVRSILEKLGLTGHPGSEAERRASTAVARIADRLDGLPSDRAHFLAAFAMVLARAAWADLEVSEEEREVIADVLANDGAMDRQQAELVADLVAHHRELGGVADDYLATRELRRIAGPEELTGALNALFAVCAADHSITLVEEEEVRQVASELGFTHQEYVAARSRYRDQREVLRGMGGGSDAKRS